MRIGPRSGDARDLVNARALLGHQDGARLGLLALLVVVASDNTGLVDAKGAEQRGSRGGGGDVVEDVALVVDPLVTVREPQQLIDCRFSEPP